ncbi:MAG TPA: hypothetical protein VND64_05290 [Pirellulales bacterium]|nr:hypothetical protein [Pirellulales bacterium]
MDIFAAAQALQDRLRGYAWLTAVAVGGLDDKEVIFVYTKHAVRNKEVDELKANGWMGHDVKIRRVGQTTPAGV